MSGKITDERQQMFEKSEQGDKLYKLALHKGWSEEQLQKIIAVVDKYAEIENRRQPYDLKSISRLDVSNDFRQAQIYTDEDIFLILETLYQKNKEKYTRFI